MKKQLLFAGLIIGLSHFGSIYSCGNDACGYQADREDKVKHARVEAWLKSLRSCEKVCVRVDYSDHEYSCGAHTIYAVPLTNKAKSTITDVKNDLVKHAPNDSYAPNMDGVVLEAEMGIIKPTVTKDLVGFRDRYRLCLNGTDRKDVLDPSMTLEQLIAAKKFDPTKQVLRCAVFSNL